MKNNNVFLEELRRQKTLRARKPKSSKDLPQTPRMDGGDPVAQGSQSRSKPLEREPRVSDSRTEWKGACSLYPEPRRGLQPITYRQNGRILVPWVTEEMGHWAVAVNGLLFSGSFSSWLLPGCDEVSSFLHRASLR